VIVFNLVSFLVAVWHSVVYLGVALNTTSMRVVMFSDFSKFFRKGNCWKLLNKLAGDNTDHNIICVLMYWFPIQELSDDTERYQSFAAGNRTRQGGVSLFIYCDNNMSPYLFNRYIFEYFINLESRST
jgi:hypothetical protein